MLLYYIRHGDPTYNPDALTDFGHQQAEALAKRLVRSRLDTIYASSSRRAIQTAEPTANALGKDINILDWCNEKYAWQEFTVCDDAGPRRWGIAVESVRQRLHSPEVIAAGENWVELSPFQGTGFASGMKRVQTETDAFLEAQGYRYDAKTNLYEIVEPNEHRIALFAHAGFGLAFLSAILRIPYPTVSTTFGLSTSGVSVIAFDNNESGYTIPKLLQLSNDSHLYKESVDQTYNKIYQL